MNKLEYTIIGLLIGGACVWMSFVIGWWTAASVHILWAAITIDGIVVIALIGLVIGIILDIFFLRNWIHRFYTLNLWLLAVIYGTFCILSVASFMGLPIGTFTLGLLAGVYAGRRQLHNPSNENADIENGLRKTALFAALMTAGAALPIGIWVLREPSIAGLFQKLLGIESWFGGLTIVCFLCIVLFAAQYWCTLLVARFTLQMRPAKA